MKVHAEYVTIAEGGSDMHTSRTFVRTMILFAGFAFFTNVLFSLGCSQMQTYLGMSDEDMQPRYPALVVTEPNFKLNDNKGDIPLNLDVIGESDSELWKDFSKLARKAKHWRIGVFKFVDESYVTGFDWRPTDNTTQHLTDMPIGSLMRAYADFCSSDNPQDDNAVHMSRVYLFLLHKLPD